MPDTKNFSLRVKVLDGMLRKKNGVTIHEMLQVINDKLDNKGIRPVKTKDTILKDIMEISNEFHVRIKRMRDTEDARIIRYRYENTDFSIYETSLTKRQIRELRYSLKVLSRCKGFPDLKWVKDLCASMDMPLRVCKKPVLEFDVAVGKIGMKNFQGLFYAIVEQRTIEITYQSEDGHPQRQMIYPYYLKQFLCKWYLVAVRLDCPDLVCLYSFDKIMSFSFRPELKYRPIEMDIADYFKDIYGIHRDKDRYPVTIKFKVPRQETRQFIDDPIHESQNVICNNQEDTIFSIFVIPNEELMQRFLSYGDTVTILTHCELRDEIVKKIRESMKNYESST